MTKVGTIARITDLHHHYGRVVALDGVSLDFSTGSLSGLVGPDGAGKSSLLALIAGVRKIQQGRVEVLGGDMASRHHRSQTCPRIAYMPQGLGRNLYPTLSVTENLNFFARIFGYSKTDRGARIRELLTATDLLPFADRAAGQLSGGMRQKLGLCCALVHEPDFLILDEPTTGVDPLSRRQFWQFVEHIRQRHPGMSVMVSTAYMDEAAQFDWLVAMNHGRVLATGNLRNLLDRTGVASLEQAFIALLPEERRREHRTIIVPPRNSDDPEPAVQSEGLTRRFGDFVAVDQVNFRIFRGEIFGFAGSNGCGKTTTMKMLTGLLPASDGRALLFGAPVDANSIETRRRIGYMSQSYSLYTELTARQNLELHARLFALPPEEITRRVQELAARFGLSDHLDEISERLPLGIRQRLSLAVAVIHRPEVLILDEPTSGVDPVGRDAFWELLISLSRDEGVTIFISTHFMNEAERCDRIALMHASKVLACDTPQNLVELTGCADLEETFIAIMRQAGFQEFSSADRESSISKFTPNVRSTTFNSERALAFAQRETLEILRDPIRLAFAVIGPVLLMLVFGYGITFDVEHLPYAALDFDQTKASRDYLEHFQGSPYFSEGAPLRDSFDLEQRMRSGELRIAIEIPPNFGRDLKRGRSPEVGVWIDGATPLRGETARGYVRAVHAIALNDPVFSASYGKQAELPALLEPRFRYNQAFRSVNAMVPSVIAVLLVFIPAVSTAVGVVREKELGSITNLYATPVTRLEFLLGKQAPYIGIAMVNFFTLVGMAIVLFGVALKAGILPLTIAALLYVTSTTGIGLLISAFAHSQIAALFATGILTMMPVVQFCGMMAPVSSLTGGAALIGIVYPTTYFMKVSVGAFTKALGITELAPNLAVLALFIPLFITASVLLLNPQEK